MGILIPLRKQIKQILCVSCVSCVAGVCVGMIGVLAVLFWMNLVSYHQHTQPKIMVVYAKPVTSLQKELVVVTGYCNGPPCTNTTHGITKSGARVRLGYCAADWTVYPKGTEFIIPGYGYCKVMDTGRIVKGRHLDLYFLSADEARVWGRQVLWVRRIHDTH